MLFLVHGRLYTWKMDASCIYIVDVDDEFQCHDDDEEPELKAIVYNTIGSNSYGNGIAFDDIDSIELDSKRI